jgi:hypothetical protein
MEDKALSGKKHIETFSVGFMIGIQLCGKYKDVTKRTKEMGETCKILLQK